VKDDFFDELTDGEPLLCSLIQMSIIESLLKISPLSEIEKSEIYKDIETYSEEEAEKIIKYLNKDAVETDVRKQWEKMFQKK
tara:strand:+ start:477 stop:722 length:246 start_codon:yes stop_codon:yes gene_type:complete